MRLCKFPNCGREMRAVRKGLCQTHERQSRAGHSLTPIGAHGFAERKKADPVAFAALCAAAGRRAHALGKAHTFKAGEEAIAAGRLGGAKRKGAGA